MTHRSRLHFFVVMLDNGFTDYWLMWDVAFWFSKKGAFEYMNGYLGFKQCRWLTFSTASVVKAWTAEYERLHG